MVAPSPTASTVPRRRAPATTNPQTVPLAIPGLVGRLTARPSPRTLAVLAVVGANALWGTSFVASQLALDRVPPLTLACLRVAIALAILWPLSHRAGDRPAFGRAPALLGLTGVALFSLLGNVGLRHADATDAALLHGAVPVLTALLAVPVLGERLGARRLTGALASLGGVAVIVSLGPGPGLGAAALGNALLLGSALSVAAYLVLGRRCFASSALLPLLTGSTAFGLLVLLPAAAVELAVVGAEPPTPRDLLLLLYLGAGCSALAFVFRAHGLRHLEAGQVAAYGNLKLPVGVTLAAVLLGESLSVGQLGGGALVLAGVWLAPTDGMSERPAAPRRSPLAIAAPGR